MRKQFQGTSFEIDRPKGYVKVWTQPDGSEKTFTYPCDYGFWPKLLGEDGEGLDAFVGDDPNGHFESFQKLKPGPSGPVLDETKFLVGVSPQDRETIYRLYGDEVHARQVYRDFEHLQDALEKFQPKKKERYMSESSMKTARQVLARYKLSGLKRADIDKLIAGQVVGRTNPAGSLDRVMTRLQELGQTGTTPEALGFNGLSALKQEAKKVASMFTAAFPALSAAMDTYSVAREQQRQQELANQMALYPGMTSTQPLMREMAMGMDPTGGAVPTVHHRRHRHHL
jgi:hypothetical protein